MKRLTKRFVRLHYYFSTGYQFLALVNFALLVVLAADKLAAFFGGVSPAFLALAAIPTAFFGMILLGYFLDSYLHYTQLSILEKESRNPTYLEMKRKVDAIHRVVTKK